MHIFLIDQLGHLTFFDVEIIFTFGLLGIVSTILLRIWLIKTNSIIPIILYWLLTLFVVFLPIKLYVEYCVYQFFKFFPNLLDWHIPGFVGVLTGISFSLFIGKKYFFRRKKTISKTPN